MAVYLLHSTAALRRAGGTLVRHYMGYTCEGGMERRLSEHIGGKRTAKIVQAFLRAGGTMEVGNYWPGLTREDERRMKRNGHLEAKCLWCQFEAAKQALKELTW